MGEELWEESVYMCVCVCVRMCVCMCVYVDVDEGGVDLTKCRACVSCPVQALEPLSLRKGKRACTPYLRNLWQI